MDNCDDDLLMMSEEDTTNNNIDRRIILKTTTTSATTNHNQVITDFNDDDIDDEDDDLLIVVPRHHPVISSNTSNATSSSASVSQNNNNKKQQNVYQNPKNNTFPSTTEKPKEIAIDEDDDEDEFDFDLELRTTTNSKNKTNNNESQQPQQQIITNPISPALILKHVENSSATLEEELDAWENEQNLSKEQKQQKQQQGEDNKNQDGNQKNQQIGGNDNNNKIDNNNNNNNNNTLHSSHPHRGSVVAMMMNANIEQSNKDFYNHHQSPLTPQNSNDANNHHAEFDDVNRNILFAGNINNNINSSVTTTTPQTINNNDKNNSVNNFNNIIRPSTWSAKKKQHQEIKQQQNHSEISSSTTTPTSRINNNNNNSIFSPYSMFVAKFQQENNNNNTENDETVQNTPDLMMIFVAEEYRRISIESRQHEERSELLSYSLSTLTKTANKAIKKSKKSTEKIETTVAKWFAKWVSSTDKLLQSKLQEANDFVESYFANELEQRVQQQVSSIVFQQQNNNNNKNNQNQIVSSGGVSEWRSPSLSATVANQMNNNNNFFPHFSLSSSSATPNLGPQQQLLEFVSLNNNNNNNNARGNRATSNTPPPPSTTTTMMTSSNQDSQQLLQQQENNSQQQQQQSSHLLLLLLQNQLQKSISFSHVPLLQKAVLAFSKNFEPLNAQPTSGQIRAEGIMADMQNWSASDFTDMGYLTAPTVLIIGPRGSGKSSVAHCLVNKKPFFSSLPKVSPTPGISVRVTHLRDCVTTHHAKMTLTKEMMDIENHDHPAHESNKFFGGNNNNSDHNDNPFASSSSSTPMGSSTSTNVMNNNNNNHSSTSFSNFTTREGGSTQHHYKIGNQHFAFAGKMPFSEQLFSSRAARAQPSSSSSSSSAADSSVTLKSSSYLRLIEIPQHLLNSIPPKMLPSSGFEVVLTFNVTLDGTRARKDLAAQFRQVAATVIAAVQERGEVSSFSPQVTIPVYLVATHVDKMKPAEKTPNALAGLLRDLRLWFKFVQETVVFSRKTMMMTTAAADNSKDLNNTTSETATTNNNNTKPKNNNNDVSSEENTFQFVSDYIQFHLVDVYAVSCQEWSVVGERPRSANTFHEMASDMWRTMSMSRPLNPVHIGAQIVSQFLDALSSYEETTGQTIENLEGIKTAFSIKPETNSHVACEIAVKSLIPSIGSAGGDKSANSFGKTQQQQHQLTSLTLPVKRVLIGVTTFFTAIGRWANSCGFFIDYALFLRLVLQHVQIKQMLEDVAISTKDAKYDFMSKVFARCLQYAFVDTLSYHGIISVHEEEGFSSVLVGPQVFARIVNCFSALHGVNRVLSIQNIAAGVGSNGVDSYNYQLETGNNNNKQEEKINSGSNSAGRGLEVRGSGSAYFNLITQLNITEKSANNFNEALKIHTSGSNTSTSTNNGNISCYFPGLGDFPEIGRTDRETANSNTNNNSSQSSSSSSPSLISPAEHGDVMKDLTAWQFGVVTPFAWRALFRGNLALLAQNDDDFFLWCAKLISPPLGFVDPQWTPENIHFVVGPTSCHLPGVVRKHATANAHLSSSVLDSSSSASPSPDRNRSSRQRALNHHHPHHLPGPVLISSIFAKPIDPRSYQFLVASLTVADDEQQPFSTTASFSGCPPPSSLCQSVLVSMLMHNKLILNQKEKNENSNFYTIQDLAIWSNCISFSTYFYANENKNEDENRNNTNNNNNPFAQDFESSNGNENKSWDYACLVLIYFDIDNYGASAYSSSGSSSSSPNITQSCRIIVSGIKGHSHNTNNNSNLSNSNCPSPTFREQQVEQQKQPLPFTRNRGSSLRSASSPIDASAPQNQNQDEETTFNPSTSEEKPPFSSSALAIEFLKNSILQDTLSALSVAIPELKPATLFRDARLGSMTPIVFSGVVQTAKEILIGCSRRACDVLLIELQSLHEKSWASEFLPVKTILETLMLEERVGPNYYHPQ